MDKQNFKILLEDLYTKFNHSKISEVTDIINNYQEGDGREFDIIKRLYFKYNHRAHPNYEPDSGNDLFITNLIKDYSEGKRTVNDKKITVDDQVLNTVQQKGNEIHNSLLETSETKISELNDFIEQNKKLIDGIISEKQKEIEGLIAKFDGLIKQKEAEFKKYISENITKLTHQPEQQTTFEQIKVNWGDIEMDIELPPNIKDMNVGNRFLIHGPDKKMLAMEIKDVFYDFVSYPDKCIKEITLSKI